jgi:hypothetical protein
MKTLKPWVASALLALCWTTAAHAVTIAVRPPTQSAGIGSQVQVDLTISGVNSGIVPALGAFDLNLGFDPALLSFQSATFGNQLDVFGLGDIQSGSLTSAGTVEAYENSLDSTADLTSHQASNFPLVSLFFNTIGSGTSPLNVSINAVADANGSALASGLTQGSVTISAVPEPATYALLLGGIGTLLIAALAQRSARKVGRPKRSFFPQRFSDSTQSSDRTGRPSCHRRPSRNVNGYFMPSFEMVE